MRMMEISVVKEGTDVESVESLLLELFGRFEKTEAKVVDRPLRARVGVAYTLLRYRVHYTHAPIRGFGPELIDRLVNRTKSEIVIAEGGEVHIFKVDRSERLL